jgi:hypothetical protein
MIDVLESAKRLVKVVTGAEGGDCEIVMDVGVGTERDSDKVWVTGNWNGDLPGRLFKALERIGVDAEWYDQVDPCDGCRKLMETDPTHYGWQPSYLIDLDCNYVCFDCLDVSNDEVLSEFGYIDNVEKAIPDVLAKHLPEWGWEPFNGTFENGWHPGQNDSPQKIFERIQAKWFKNKRSVVFRLDETSQFYIKFTAWTKAKEVENDEE